MFASRVAVRSARVAAPRMPIAAARGYAAPAQAANTKPPVPLYGLDGTYASALVCPPNDLWVIYHDGSS